MAQAGDQVQLSCPVKTSGETDFSSFSFSIYRILHFCPIKTSGKTYFNPFLLLVVLFLAPALMASGNFPILKI